MEDLQKIAKLLGGNRAVDLLTQRTRQSAACVQLRNWLCGGTKNCAFSNMVPGNNAKNTTRNIEKKVCSSVHLLQTSCPDAHVVCLQHSIKLHLAKIKQKGFGIRKKPTRHYITSRILWRSICCDQLSSMLVGVDSHGFSAE